ncbi:hypothetical protein [Dietzia lutea]|uniref:hypothetical protein n=1 Tax=Dietzia lutea TaxID=546160 RepID=UPI00132FB574|nr:hypothetical protein [Dietzia lutea]
MSVEALDVRPHPDVAVTHVVQDQRVDHGVRLVELVVGLREPEPHRVAGEELEHARVDELHDRSWQRPAGAQRVRGPAEDVLGHEVVAATHTDVDRGGVLDLAAELAVEARDVGLGEGAVRDHHRRELPGVSLGLAVHLVVVVLPVLTH